MDRIHLKDACLNLGDEIRIVACDEEHKKLGWLGHRCKVVDFYNEIYPCFYPVPMQLGPSNPTEGSIAMDLDTGDFADLWIEIVETNGLPGREPANNDGREVCYWCSVPTKKVGITATLFDVCPTCKR